MSALNEMIAGPKVRQELTEQLLAEMQHLNATQTAMMARLRGGLILNDVLGVEQILIPAAGFVQRDYPVAVGSVVVVNLSATAVTFATGGGTAAPPTVGTGVQTVPASSWLAIPVGATTFTLYGTAGATVDLQVFSGMLAFGGGSV
jgi:hypothetical protein